MDRRKFFQTSLWATSGFVIAPLYVSCSSDDDEVIDIPNLETDNFFEGVASFDPTDTQVVIWTRFTPENGESSITLNWQIATDVNFNDLVRSGEVSTDSSRDYTVAIDVQELPANTKFFYRFFQTELQLASPIGETITLPQEGTAMEKLSLGVCSCANFAAGLFNVYQAMANSDVDLIVHLGDYIYEYADGEYGTNETTNSLNRNHKPSNEIVNLTEYRARYRQYRGDKDLKLAHQKKPFITVWDDHEITNDAWTDGAENHNDGEGSYEMRKQVAIQVYSEYLPVRTNDPSKIYRTFNYGNLVSLHMLDTRVIGRNEQLSFGQFTDPNTGVVDFAAFGAALQDPQRTILGSEQKAWLSGQVSSSNAIWQVLGQQVLMGKMFMPAELLILIGQIVGEVSATGSASPDTVAAYNATVAQLIDIKQRILAGQSVSLEEQGRLGTVVPYNLDAWDGYASEREQLYAGFTDKKIVCLAGDTHNAWFSELKDAQENKIGVEFATSSVTSPGFEQYIGLNGPEEIEAFQTSLEFLIDDLQYAQASQRGYLKVEFTMSAVTAQWNFVDTISSESFTESIGRTETYSV